ncbi:MAG TPA: retropepsin-like aspartic protease [Candidatus Binatia bacterium]|nr:retropepsin-like aspartic protease [Candidatus Binatia bacterium]
MTARRRSAVLAVALAAALVAAAARPAPAAWAYGSESEIALEGSGSTWQVRATVNGRLTGLFLLDTGATFCVLTPAAARRLGLAPGDRQVLLRTANGPVAAPLVELGTVEVGGNRAQGVEAVIQPAVEAPLDGIIGLTFLNRFSYSIIPSRRVLRLR